MPVDVLILEMSYSGVEIVGSSDQNVNHPVVFRILSLLNKHLSLKSHDSLLIGDLTGRQQKGRTQK